MEEQYSRARINPDGFKKIADSSTQKNMLPSPDWEINHSQKERWWNWKRTKSDKKCNEKKCSITLKTEEITINFKSKSKRALTESKET